MSCSELRNEGTTIVLSTHIIAIAEQICDRIAIMNKGSVVAQGTNEDLKHYAKSSDKTLEDIFLRLTSDYVSSGSSMMKELSILLAPFCGL